MKLKTFLEKLLEEDTTKKPLSYRIVEALLMVCFTSVMFILVSAGLRRISPSYDKICEKWIVRVENVLKE